MRLVPFLSVQHQAVNGKAKASFCADNLRGFIATSFFSFMFRFCVRIKEVRNVEGDESKKILN